MSEYNDVLDRLQASLDAMRDVSATSHFDDGELRRAEIAIAINEIQSILDRVL